MSIFRPGTVFSHPSQLSGDMNGMLDLYSVPDRMPHDHVLMIKPTYYQSNSQVVSVHKPRAEKEHRSLQKIYEGLGYKIDVLVAPTEYPAAVFAADSSFPFLGSDGWPEVALSRMSNPERQGEEKMLAWWYRQQGYRVHSLSESVKRFEGMGDALWYPGKNIILGGTGLCTDLNAYHDLTGLTGAMTFVFGLRNPYFQHLNTALSILDRNFALVCEEAFSSDALEVLRFLFPFYIPVNLKEAQEGLACNAHCPDQKNVIIQKGNSDTIAKLLANDFIPHEVDTSEFIKAGSSVFGMKNMLPNFRFE